MEKPKDFAVGLELHHYVTCKAPQHLRITLVICHAQLFFSEDKSPFENIPTSVNRVEDPPASTSNAVDLWFMGDAYLYMNDSSIHLSLDVASDVGRVDDVISTAGLIHSIQMVVLYFIFVTSSEFQRDDTAGFEIVHPVLSDISGNTVSHAQLHGNRFKRDSARTDTLYLNITGQGQAFEIHLNENRNLLAPGFKVYHRKRSKDSAEVVETVESSSGGPYHQSTTCHYSGRERSRGGRAALSLCDGLNGIIRIAEEDYIIEPYKQHRVRPSFDPLSGPHKLYRRSTLNTKQTQFCGKAKRRRGKFTLAECLSHIRARDYNV
uniref:Peptidase M12B propeptide domain-containing protein n=1 Tax=Magallana gigas TaxID=29159 RepID=A0A8W8JTA6_MAGGI